MGQAQGRAVRVVIPAWLLREMDAQVEEEYGKRGRSRWVDEAVIDLVQYPDWKDCLFAPNSALGTEGGSTKQFSLSPAGAEALEKAIAEVRRDNPYVEGVISEIVRTAISQRLLRPRGR